MLLIDALYINNSGGKILLGFLIAELEKRDLEILYLLDGRIVGNHPAIKASNKVIYSEGSLVKRHLFYKKYSTSIDKVFCFGNLPPTYKLKVPVYTYFHQKLFLAIPKELPLKQKVVFLLKSKIFKKLRTNTQFWMVQTEVVKKDFLDKFPDTNKENVLLMPFYPSNADRIAGIPREKNNFVYVSNGSPHKNHLRLLEGFSNYYKKHKAGKLYLTIGKEFQTLQTLIKDYQEKGIPIVNVGFLKKEGLEQLYQKSEFLIFPSLTESFGLGLLEAMENGCKIIGADLPYTHAVCVPSLIFDPSDVESLTTAFHQATSTITKPTKQLVFNEIHKLIEILK
jgi:glycosyltransferase involved in cell wall biosynthesis